MGSQRQLLSKSSFTTAAQEMRLINTRTLRLERFYKATQIPPYAILSHTWGVGEVSLQTFQKESVRSSRKGFSKIKSACQEAHRQGLDYLWVDTCCIDKTSSAELSEAINSMFKWYQMSQICYAFCEDVGQSSINSPDTESTPDSSEKEFAASRWFTRGWTLQELIAPKEVIFYNKDWVKMGEKSTSSELIREITGVDTFILEGGPLPEVSVGRRMSWAVDRETTREEDIAYSLMGLFDINMPLLYGEGPKAFIRLQEEILRQSDDHTLFAWRSAPESTTRGTTSGLLAEHPRNFRNFRSHSDITREDAHEAQHTNHKDHIARVWDHRAPQNPITITNKGIRITSRVVDLRAVWSPGQSLILILNCSPGGGDTERATGIYIRRQYEDRYARVRTDELAEVRLNRGEEISWRTLHGLKAGGAELRGHQFDKPWTTSYDIRKEYLASQGLDGQDAEDAKASLLQYEGAFQLCEKSFSLSSVWGAYTLYSVGMWQAHGAWRFFRFDPQSESGDAIFVAAPGREVALLYHAPDRPDLLIAVVLGVDAVTREHWVNAGSVDEVLLSREGINIAKFLKVFRETAREYPLYSHDHEVSLEKRVLSTRVWVQNRHPVVEGMLMHRVQLTGPWPSSRDLVTRGPMLLYPFFILYTSIAMTITGLLIWLVGLLAMLFEVGMERYKVEWHWQGQVDETEGLASYWVEI